MSPSLNEVITVRPTLFEFYLKGYHATGNNTFFPFVTNEQGTIKITSFKKYDATALYVLLAEHL